MVQEFFLAYLIKRLRIYQAGMWPSGLPKTLLLAGFIANMWIDGFVFRFKHCALLRKRLSSSCTQRLNR
jgi:hypothetical protein